MKKPLVGGALLSKWVHLPQKYGVQIDNILETTT